MSTEASEISKVTRIKAELLCGGIRPSSLTGRVFAAQNPCRDYKTGNVGIHLVLPGESHVLATVCHAFDRASAFELEADGEALYLVGANGACLAVRAVLPPVWYAGRTSTDQPMPSLFLHEGRTFLHQAYSGCDFHLDGAACRFCAAGTTWKTATPGETAEVIAAAIAENDAYHVCLGGGTRLPLERNIEYFSACLAEIRSLVPRATIWIEMTPPRRPGDVSHLIENGACGFGFNLEIWDDAIRSTVCPGKAAISKDTYLRTMEEAVCALGPNRVGSCLIVGLEPLESCIDGINTLASLGVQPCLLPFKPWDRSEFCGLPHCSPDTLIEVSEVAVRAMIHNGLDPNKNVGCLACEACTIDHDLFNARERHRSTKDEDRHSRNN